MTLRTYHVITGLLYHEKEEKQQIYHFFLLHLHDYYV